MKVKIRKTKEKLPEKELIKKSEQKYSTQVHRTEKKNKKKQKYSTFDQ